LNKLKVKTVHLIGLCINSNLRNSKYSRHRTISIWYLHYVCSENPYNTRKPW